MYSNSRGIDGGFAVVDVQFFNGFYASTLSALLDLVGPELGDCRRIFGCLLCT